MKKIKIVYNEGGGSNDYNLAKIKLPKMFTGLPSKVYTEKAVQNVRDGLYEKFAIKTKALEAKIKELTPEPIIPLYKFEVVISNGAEAELEDDTVIVEAQCWSVDKDAKFFIDKYTVAMFDGKSIRRIIRKEQVSN